MFLILKDVSEKGEPNHLLKVAAIYEEVPGDQRSLGQPTFRQLKPAEVGSPGMLNKHVILQGSLYTWLDGFAFRCYQILG